MISRKDTKYKLDYTANTDIPGKLWPYMCMVIKRNPVMWFMLIITDLLHGVRYPIAFVLMGMTIDSLVGLTPDQEIPQETWMYAGMLFAVLFFGELMHLIPHYITFDWWKRARAELRSDLFAYTLQHSFTYFQNHFAGSLARKVTEGIEKALALNEQIRWQLLLPLTVMGTTSIIMIKVSLLYSGLVFIFLFLILFPVLLKIKKLQEKSRIYADRCSDVSGQVVDSLSNIASVKSYANEEREMQEHTHFAQEQMKAWHKMLRVFLLLDNYRRMTLVLFGGGMMVACIKGWQAGLISFGDIATIMGLAFNFTGNAWQLSMGVIHIMESLGYLNDSLTTLVTPHAVKDRKNAKNIEVREAKIEFENVNFEYDSQAVFNDLHITIPPKQRVGLIGPSGAGKSTLINLIQRFFDIQSGAIKIDDQNIADVTQNSLRQNIAIIPQDTTLFHRTILENIRYGKLDASDEEVLEASKKAHAHDFISALPEGYGTYVGERGVKLSGGQRQRIAIARAILKDAPILILDEATSALDSESEREIQAALENLMQNKTVIAVAHRLSTINTLDRLLVMQNGVILEDGTHNSLLDKNGLYAKLWSMQSGGFLQD